MMFATLVIERAPLTLRDLPAICSTWVQIVGGFCAAGLVVWLILGRFIRLRQLAPWPRWQNSLFRLCLVGMFAGYGLYGVLRAPTVLGQLMTQLEGQTKSTVFASEALQTDALLVGGGCAVLAVALPFLADLFFRWRWRRIWALARLSFKEALRRRVLWGFTGFLLVLLFASWFIPYKHEDQVRNYVRVVYWAMTPLLLVTAGLLAAFSIPADVRNQTIHTIVTKPVERFEIVLGRFLGYTMLMTLVLVVMTGVSLIYVSRNLDPEAEFESKRARVPVYGNLVFRGKEGFQGDNVGREWDYRRYIAGGANSLNRAVWVYQDLPRDLAERKELTVPCEFSFDIFRTVKGEEGKGVFCSFTFVTRHWDQKNQKDYTEALASARKLAQGADRKVVIDQLTRTILDRAPSEEETQAFTKDHSRNATDRVIGRLLAEKYGVYEIPSKEVVDYHTQSVDVPTSLFKNALSGEPRRSTGRGGEDSNTLVEVRVKCDSGGQYLGAAKYDFYILDAERPFALNFFKGAFGLWLRLCLVIGLAVVCSTYLTGVVAWLTTMVLYCSGLILDYIRSLVEGTSLGGGPMESVLRLVSHEPMVTTLDKSPGVRLVQGTDQVFRVVLRFLQYAFPDVERLDWTDYISEGFNIGTVEMILPNVVLLVGYLVPCALVAYYLMKSREIAS
jgi:ABC-type transport system involved in multi-copper enzyme maturation permease subunit